MEMRRYKVVTETETLYFLSRKCAFDFAKTDPKSKVYQNMNLPSKSNNYAIEPMEEKWVKMKK